jgi:hypothetical protein
VAFEFKFRFRVEPRGLDGTHIKHGEYLFFSRDLLFYHRERREVTRRAAFRGRSVLRRATQLDYLKITRKLLFC